MLKTELIKVNIKDEYFNLKIIKMISYIVINNNYILFFIYLLFKLYIYIYVIV